MDSEVEKKRHGIRFYGERYYAVKLCEMFCVVDTLPDDPGYVQRADYDCVVYFQKVVRELPYSQKNADLLLDEAIRLEKEWLADPRREAKLKERDHTNRIIRRRWNEKRSILSAGEKPRRWTRIDTRKQTKPKKKTKSKKEKNPRC